MKEWEPHTEPVKAHYLGFSSPGISAVFEAFISLLGAALLPQKTVDTNGKWLTLVYTNVKKLQSFAFPVEVFLSVRQTAPGFYSGTSFRPFLQAPLKAPQPE